MIMENDFVNRLYNRLCDILEEYHSNGDDMLMEKVFTIAKNIYGEQKNKAGQLKIIHSLQVAVFLATFGMSKVVVLAAILHDIINDVENMNLGEQCGRDVFILAKEISKVEGIFIDVPNKALAKKNISELIFKAEQDRRAVIIKVIDQIHTMLTQELQESNNKSEIICQTINICVLIINMLGASELTINHPKDLLLKDDIWWRE